MRKIYTARRKQLIESLTQHFLAEEISIGGENAGLHIMLWLNTVDQSKQSLLLQQCQAQSIALFPIDTRSINTPSINNRPKTTKVSGNRQCAVIIGFSQIEESAIDPATLKSRAIVRQFA